MIHAHSTSMRLERPIGEVFDFFSDTGNLERITPRELRFRVLTPLPIEIRVGSLIDYELRLIGVRFRWRTEIAIWEPPAMFVDTQLRGPYRLWVHTHRFREVDGGTVIEDEVKYTLPLGPLGMLALPIVRGQIRRIFRFRERAIRELLS